MNDRLKDAFSRRAPLFLVILGGLFLGIFVKFGYIMLFLKADDPGFTNANPRNRQPEPPRGKILDVNGNLLATSVQRQSLVANPRQISDKQAWPLAKTLSNKLDKSAPSLYKKFTKDRYFVWVARKLAPGKVKQLRDLDLEGLRFQPEYERVYPQGELAASVLGFVGVDNQGLEGVEKQFNGVLTQVGTYQSSVKDAGSGQGKGVSVRLTIDQTIQHIVQEELYRVVEREKPEDAMVIAMEPETGRIRAMVNWPSYNPNRYWEFESSARRNRIITDVFEPGSTLKPVSLAIGLSNGDFNPASSFHCKGHTYLPTAKHTIHCHAKHGSLTIPEILIQSCNVGAVKATQRISAKDYYTSLRDFGLGTWTGVRLPGESKGALRRPSGWSAMTQSSMAIGQGLSTTALQVTNAINVIANDGVLLKPRIASAIKANGDSMRRVKPFEIRRVIPRHIAEDMQRYMQKVVDRGTGKRAGLKDYVLAGKTGTAQKPNREEGGYYQDKFLASFVGFGPGENPELVVGVFLDDPKKHQYGGEVAAPLFRTIMKRSLRYLKNRDGSKKLVNR